jgi:coproporphyrinogen III oxidase
MSERGERANRYFSALQEQITTALGRVDGAPFVTDAWTRPGGGGGRSCVIERGAAIEKGAVNVSCVFGEMGLEFAANLPGEGREFFATGISLIIHPRNPHAPTVHMNFRYLEKGGAAWFGGGADLTPCILYPEDAVHFHQVWREACRRHPEVADHGEMKRGCDEYFRIPHRNEARGIGGIFFDYLGAARERPVSLDAVERFVIDAAGRFLESYQPILERRKDTTFSEAERRWQLIRRGRYVEFNLMYDRGTIFGLKTGGRIESILASLPSPVEWAYNVSVPAGSREAELLDVLKTPRDWL